MKVYLRRFGGISPDLVPQFTGAKHGNGPRQERCVSGRHPFPAIPSLYREVAVFPNTEKAPSMADADFHRIAAVLYSN
jgi:hypothetical protein